MRRDGERFICETLQDYRILLGMIDLRDTFSGAYTIVLDWVGADWQFVIPGKEPYEETLRKYVGWCGRFGIPDNDVVGEYLRNLIDRNKA
jgi:hypothetical protein